MAAQAKPRILLIALDEGMPDIDGPFADLIDRLMKKAQLQRTRKPAPTIKLLSEAEDLKAVFLTDGALANPKHASVWDAVLKYARNGGTVVCMGCFSTSVRFDEMDAFFAKAGIP